jgi:hypothetical protein
VTHEHRRLRAASVGDVEKRTMDAGKKLVVPCSDERWRERKCSIGCRYLGLCERSEMRPPSIS